MTKNSLKGTRVVGLARQSRGDGASVAEQIEQLKFQCERDGAELVAIYQEEDVSGQSPLDRRHGLRQAVGDIEDKRAEVLMVVYFDRLVRSMKTQAEVVERVESAKGRVVTLDMGEISNGTAAQWLSASMLGMVSEYYARSVGERVAESKQANIDKGVPPFPRITPAYRRRKDGTLEPHPTRAPIVRDAIQMRLATPPASYTAIARWMIEQGIEITPGGVEQLFASKLLVGEIRFGNFRPNLNAIEDPLIDRATQRRLLAQRAPRGRNGKSDRLLARLGILLCETCDARMIVQSTASKGKRYYYYRCGNPLCKQGAVIAVATAEEKLRDEAIRLSAEVVGRADAADELEDARVAMVETDERLQSAIRTLASVAGEVATIETLDALQVERDEAADHYARLLAVSAPSRTLRTTEDWDRLSFTERRDLISALIARASVAPGRGDNRITVVSRSQLLAQ